MALGFRCRLPYALGTLTLVLGASLPAAAAPLDEGDDQYRFLVGLIDKGLYEMAVDEAQTFLREYEDHPKAELARYRLAIALFELDRWKEAAPHLQALAGSSGFDYRAESAFRLGQCELSRDRPREATAALRMVLELDQDYLHGPATFFLGEAAFRAERVDEAEARYQELLRDHPDSEYVAGARRGLAWCSWERGEAEPTVSRTRAYLQHHGQEAGADEVRILLGEALLEQELPDEALEAFGAVRDPAFRDARRRGLGFAHAARGDARSSATEFAALIEKHPESRFVAEARLQLGIQTLRAGNAAAATRTLRTASESGDPEALYWLSQAQEATGDPQAALVSLDRALKARPTGELEGRIQVARGDVLAQLGRSDAAVVAYESGGSEYSLYAAAVSSMNRGDAENAIRLVRKLFETNPETTYAIEARLVLGEAYFSRGDLVRAEKAFRTVLASKATPEHGVRAQARLGWCRFLAGDLEGAEESFEAVVRDHPEQAEAEEALNMLCRVRLESGDRAGARDASGAYLQRYPQGRYRDQALFASARTAEPEAALRDLENLVARHPDSPLVPGALLELGDAMSEAGRLEEASRRYSAILENHPQSEVAPAARYGLGWCQYRAGDHARAAVLLERVGGDRDAAPQLRQASLELAVWAHCENGDPRAATEAWRRFLGLCTDDARRFEAARTVASAWRDAGEPAQAQAVLDELLRGMDDPAIAVGVLIEGAYLALEEGDVDRADAQVQVARRRASEAPEVAEAAFFVGEARFAAGEDERAVELYRAAVVETSPVRADALYKLGFTLLRNDELPGAEDAFRVVVDEHRESELWGESLFLLGEVRFRRERFEACADALDLLRREEPEHEVLPKALFRLGLTLGRLERWPECEAALAELARNDPEFSNLAEAELWRGRALAAQRKERAARQAFERVTALDRGELAAQARIGLGLLHESEDRYEEALSEYLKVAVLFGHDEEVAEALFRAGTCLERLGDPERALQQYREVVDEHPRSRWAAAARERSQSLRTR